MTYYVLDANHAIYFDGDDYIRYFTGLNNNGNRLIIPTSVVDELTSAASRNQISRAYLRFLTQIGIIFHVRYSRELGIHIRERADHNDYTNNGGGVSRTDVDIVAAALMLAERGQVIVLSDDGHVISAIDALKNGRQIGVRGNKRTYINCQNNTHTALRQAYA